MLIQGQFLLRHLFVSFIDGLCKNETMIYTFIQFDLLTWSPNILENVEKVSLLQLDEITVFMHFNV